MRAKADRVEAGPGSLTVRLYAPGMTALHRVGLGGLAMTLRALEADRITAGQLARLGEWEVSDREVTLRWRDDGAEFFGALFRASYRLTGSGLNSGLIWLAGLGDPAQHWDTAAVLHNAMLGTFLQHGPTTRDSAVKKVRARNMAPDGSAPVVVRFLPLTAYKHQGVAFGNKRAVRFDGATSFQVGGWLYPGGVVRHWLYEKETSFSEPADRALALLFAPVGAIFFEVRRESAGARPEYCIVLPEITDVATYADARQLFWRGGAERLQVAGRAEAAARVLAEFAAYRVVRGVRADACTVVAFGVVKWSKQQKTRVQRFSVRGVKPESVRIYQIALSRMPEAERVMGKPDATGQPTFWWRVPQVPDLVAQNVLTGVPWWRGFAGLWDRLRAGASRESRGWVLSREREGLHQMVTDTRVMPEGPEARLVRACHEAWRRRAGALWDQSKKEGRSFDDLYDREYERVRVSFARCRNAAMLRETLTDFWARARSLPQLQEGWADVLPLLGTRWQEARDLALLALASYKGQDREEEEPA